MNQMPLGTISYRIISIGLDQEAVSVVASDVIW